MAAASERVPLWYHRGYSVEHAAEHLMQGFSACYTREDAARRVLAYADWLRRQEEGPEGRPTG